MPLLLQCVRGEEEKEWYICDERIIIARSNFTHQLHKILYMEGVYFYGRK
jgi:hypothetical protein